jgi:RNA polymerase sigma factor (sigma-70 family)
MTRRQWEEIYKKYERLFAWFVYKWYGKLEREDVLSICYEALIRCVDNWEEERGASFNSLLTLIIKRLLIQRLREKMREDRHIRDDSIDVEWLPTTTYTESLYEIMPEKITERERVIMTMTAQGYTSFDVGSELGITHQRVSQILHGLRRKEGVMI